MMSNKEKSFKVTLLSLIGISITIMLLILVYDLLENFPIPQSVVYWIAKGLLFVTFITESVKLLDVQVPIKNRISKALLISVFMVVFCTWFHRIDFDRVTVTEWIESTYVDRTNMSYSDKMRFINELRPHFNAAVVGSIRSGDCRSVEEFLDHLKVATITSNMSESTKISAVVTNYMLSYCKRR